MEILQKHFNSLLQSYCRGKSSKAENIIMCLVGYKYNIKRAWGFMINTNLAFGSVCLQVCIDHKSSGSFYIVYLYMLEAYPVFMWPVSHLQLYYRNVAYKSRAYLRISRYGRPAFIQARLLFKPGLYSMQESHQSCMYILHVSYA